jgi:hypothetical protein
MSAPNKERLVSGPKRSLTVAMLACLPRNKKKRAAEDAKPPKASAAKAGRGDTSTAAAPAPQIAAAPAAPAESSDDDDDDSSEDDETDDPDDAARDAIEHERHGALERLLVLGSLSCFWSFWCEHAESRRLMLRGVALLRDARLVAGWATWRATLLPVSARYTLLNLTHPQLRRGWSSWCAWKASTTLAAWALQRMIQRTSMCRAPTHGVPLQPLHLGGGCAGL